MKTQTQRPRVAQSLTTTLALAFFVLSVIALLISGGLQLFFNLQTQQTIIAGNQQLIAQDAARIVSSFIQEKFGVLETAVGLTNLDELSQAEQEEVLSSLLGRQLAFHHLVLFNTQGQILAQASRLSMGEYRQFLDRLTDIRWDQNPQMSRTISQVYIDPVTSEPMVIMTVPMVDVFGDFKGTLLAEVNLKFMWDLVDRLQVGQTGRAYVVDRGGNLIAFGDMARVLRGENVAHLPAVSEFIRNLGSTRPNEGKSYRGIMGTAVVGTYVPLGTPDWAVITELPWAETYQDVIRETVWAGGITLVIAALASLLGVYLARRLAVPLVNLTGVATQIAGGERELQAVVEGPKEVASLAVAFNSMTTQLRQTLAGLEQQIAERRQAEKALRESEERLQQAVRVSHIGIFDHDHSTDTIYMSPEYWEMWDWAPEETGTLPKFFERVYPEDRERAEEARRRAHDPASDGVFDLEYRIIRRDGAVRWLATRSQTFFEGEGDAGRPVRTVGAVLDVTESRQAEEALRVKDKAIASAINAIVIAGANNIVAYVNPSLLRLWGYDNEEQVLGKSAQELWTHPPEEVDRIMETMMAEGSWIGEVTAQRKDGSRFEAQLSASSIKDEAGAPVYLMGSLMDITERKRVEEELRTSEIRYRALVESQIDLISRYRPDTILTFVNDAYCQFYGKTREEVIGQSFLTMVAPEYREQAFKETENFLKDPSPIGGEYLNYRWDGKECWIHWIIQGIVGENGDVVELQATGRDVTPLKQAEEEIRLLNEELEQRVAERTQQLQETLTFQEEIMRASSTGMVVYDSTGQCVLANEASAKMINASLAQVLAQNYHHIEPWQKSGLYETALAAVENGLEQQQDVHTVSSFGKEVWLNCRFVPFNSGGQPHLLLTVNDMTERIQAETEIRELNQQLQAQTDNLAAANKELEAFSYSVSHDLRAPLRAIDGYSRILLEDYESALDVEGKRVCTVIRRQTQRMGGLIDDLLAFSRLSRTDMQSSPIDMSTLVTSVFHELTMSPDRERIDFQVEPLPPAMGDPALIRQVWINLLANAVKFSANRERAVIEVSGRQEAGETIYVVGDNGAGFEMQYADKLFGVFQRLHSEREFEGTGVGLATVQRIIHRHGGRVWAEGQVDQGPTFYFPLPRKETDYASD